MPHSAILLYANFKFHGFKSGLNWLKYFNYVMPFFPLLRGSFLRAGEAPKGALPTARGNVGRGQRELLGAGRAVEGGSPKLPKAPKVRGLLKPGIRLEMGRSTLSTPSIGSLRAQRRCAPALPETQRATRRFESPSPLEALVRCRAPKAPCTARTRFFLPLPSDGREREGRGRVQPSPWISSQPKSNSFFG